eukprot:TRINITY_DN23746_c1_g1_i1.p2 TRINITY_DN23746_c1_g1~~TRINITY_DN23746_c1_g1_i1.p2  ORF type:complete len:254 (+),score=-25.55 TRINITY_DN23746_c1_g1_i1:351-1112(+)
MFLTYRVYIQQCQVQQNQVQCTYFVQYFKLYLVSKINLYFSQKQTTTSENNKSFLHPRNLKLVQLQNIAYNKTYLTRNKQNSTNHPQHILVEQVSYKIYQKSHFLIPKSLVFMEFSAPWIIRIPIIRKLTQIKRFLRIYKAQKQERQPKNKLWCFSENLVVAVKLLQPLFIYFAIIHDVFLLCPEFCYTLGVKIFQCMLLFTFLYSFRVAKLSSKMGQILLILVQGSIQYLKLVQQYYTLIINLPNSLPTNLY